MLKFNILFCALLIFASACGGCEQVGGEIIIRDARVIDISTVDQAKKNSVGVMLLRSSIEKDNYVIMVCVPRSKKSAAGLFTVKIRQGDSLLFSMPVPASYPEGNSMHEISLSVNKSIARDMQITILDDGTNNFYNISLVGMIDDLIVQSSANYREALTKFSCAKINGSKG